MYLFNICKLLFVIKNKIQDQFNNSIDKLPISKETKKKISLYFDKNKINLSKNIKNYTVYDFDLLIEFYCEILEESQRYVESSLNTIYEAINVILIVH